MVKVGVMHEMKKRLFVLLIALALVATTLTGCGHVLKGKFTSQSGLYQVNFNPDGTCTWYQGGTFFEGKYYWDDVDNCYNLDISGGGLYGNTHFSAEVNGRELIINGGYVNNETFNLGEK